MPAPPPQPPVLRPPSDTPSLPHTLPASSPASDSTPPTRRPSASRSQSYFRTAQWPRNSLRIRRDLFPNRRRLGQVAALHRVDNQIPFHGLLANLRILRPIRVIQ